MYAGEREGSGDLLGFACAWPLENAVVFRPTAGKIWSVARLVVARYLGF